MMSGPIHSTTAVDRCRFQGRVNSGFWVKLNTTCWMLPFFLLSFPPFRKKWTKTLWLKKNKRAVQLFRNQMLCWKWRHECTQPFKKILLQGKAVNEVIILAGKYGCSWMWSGPEIILDLPPTEWSLYHFGFMLYLRYITVSSPDGWKRVLVSGRQELEPVSGPRSFPSKKFN